MFFNVKRIGLSKFVIGFLGAFVFGIFIADKIPANLIIEIVFIIAILLSIIIFWKQKNKLILLGLITILGFMLGLFYYHFWDYREDKKTLTYNQIVTTENCVVDGKPVVDASTQKIILSCYDTKILVTAGRYPEYAYGDVLKITGKIINPKSEKTTDNFNYGEYLLKHGIRGQILNPEKIEKVGNQGNIITKNIYKVGDQFENSLNKILPEPYAAFCAGIILGVKRNIPDSLMTAFNRTSTTHIVAVSGYNLMIIVTSIGLLLVPLSRRWAFWGCFIAIIIFVILTGAVASVMRAAILAILVLWCKLLGRRPYYPVLILLVGSIMLLFNPYALKNDLSFQLSYLAFIGLVVISPKIGALKLIQNWPNIIKIPFCETMGAQITVLPILLYNFGILSIVAPVVNILVLPTISYTMFFGFLAGVSGMIWLKMGYIMASIAWIFLKYIIIIVEFFSPLPYAAITIKANEWWWIPIYYMIVILLMRNIKINNEKDEI